MMKVINKIKEFKDYQKSMSGHVGFVPTLGGLHKGHLSLIRKSVKENDITVVSIFLNPLQFDDEEDFKNYPVALESDLKKLEAFKTVVGFVPSKEDMFPEDYEFFVDEKKISPLMCGRFRPNFFKGVMTIVLKLFSLVKPRTAYFGEKDYQQYILIKAMVEAFFLDIEIKACPIVRDKEGLALSSRNELLSEEKRKKASEFYKTLKENKSLEELSKILKEKGFEVDYVEEHFKRRLGAVVIDKVRLIDNVSLKREVL